MSVLQILVAFPYCRICKIAELQNSNLLLKECILKCGLTYLGTTLLSQKILANLKHSVNVLTHTSIKRREHC